MNARHVVIFCCVISSVGVGCKGRARFKPRASSSLTRSMGSSDFRTPRSFDVDDFTSRPRGDEVDRLIRRELQRDLERDATSALKEALEESVERHCATTSKTRYLEPQGAGLQSLFRTLRRVNAPSDVRVPAATKVMGLPVQLMVMDLEDPRWCADGDEALVKQVTMSGPAHAALVRVGPGAWLVLTKQGELPASSALVSPSFLSSLGVAGSLVAFAPTDHAIALADASKPEAIRQAAKMLWGHVDVTGADGVLQAQPLVLTKGEWRAWAPKSPVAEVTALRKLTDELETKMGADITADLIETTEALSLIPGSGLPPFDLGSGTKTTRLVDEKRRVRVDVELDSEDAQLVGRAEVVRVSSVSGREFDTGWSAFTSKAGGSLTPVKVDGVVVPNVFRLAPSFSWPSSL